MLSYSYSFLSVILYYQYSFSLLKYYQKVTNHKVTKSQIWREIYQPNILIIPKNFVLLCQYYAKTMKEPIYTHPMQQPTAVRKASMMAGTSLLGGHFHVGAEFDFWGAFRTRSPFFLFFLSSHSPFHPAKNPSLAMATAIPRCRPIILNPVAGMPRCSPPTACAASACLLANTSSRPLNKLQNKSIFSCSTYNKGVM